MFGADHGVEGIDGRLGTKTPDAMRPGEAARTPGVQDNGRVREEQAMSRLQWQVQKMRLW